MAELAASHHVPTIVDSFLALAVDVARANDFAAVALPGGDPHLLPNVVSVERELLSRFAARSGFSSEAAANDSVDGMLQPARQVDARFEGYERGRDAVGTLHVVWNRPAAT